MGVSFGFRCWGIDPPIRSISDAYGTVLCKLHSIVIKLLVNFNDWNKGEISLTVCSSKSARSRDCQQFSKSFSDKSDGRRHSAHGMRGMGNVSWHCLISRNVFIGRMHIVNSFQSFYRNFRNLEITFIQRK